MQPYAVKNKSFYFPTSWNKVLQWNTFFLSWKQLYITKQIIFQSISFKNNSLSKFYASESEILKMNSSL